MNTNLEEFDLDDLKFEREGTTSVSMETPIPESNVGYKLLQKMGWKKGKGLGSQGQGRVDPIRINLKDDALGIGKAEEYLSNHISSTSKRKATELEKQLEEDHLKRFERELQVEKKQAITKEIHEVTRAFYCELCDKQYKMIIEYENHLQSYDHHHKKRFKDMKDATKNSSLFQTEREKKLARERKREEKELKRMQEAIQKKIDSNKTNVSSSTTTTVTTAASSGGGWSQVTTTESNGGGWSQIEPIESKNNGGGWAQVTTSETKSNRVGWSQVESIETKSNSGGWSQVESAEIKKGGGWSQVSDTQLNENKKEPSIIKETPIENKKTQTTETGPKKLTFGLKKTGFQFGLKKK